MKRDGGKGQKINMENNKGSVTVFFIIIFLCVILLTGSMIDVSRILVAENKMDSAMRASTKSLMAEYNEDLIGSYGIFANQLDANKEVFANYLKKNLELSSNAFMDYELLPDTVRVVGNDDTTLDDDAVLQSQINSYMKEKAPVNTALRTMSRVTDFLKEILSSKYTQDVTSKKNNSLDTVLDEGGDVLGTDKDAIDSNTPDKLKQAEDILNKEWEEMYKNSQDLKDQLEESFKDDLKEAAIEAGSLDELNGTGDQAALIKQISGQVAHMRELSDDILKKEKELADERAEDPETQDQSKIDRLENEIADLKNQYETERLRIADEMENVRHGYGGHETFSFDFFENMNKLDKTIPGINVSPESESEAFSTTNALQNFTLFKTLMDLFKNGLSMDNLIKNTADKYYGIEYVMDRCTYATSGTERALSQFQYGEVEYILIGSESQRANLLGTFAKIFAFCYVINVLDLCLNGVPLWPAALLGSLAYTANSLYKIYNGEKYVPLDMFLGKCGLNSFKGLIGLGYSDLLYLQLILQPNEHTLDRIRKLIIANINGGETEGGIEARDLYTQVDTEAQASVNLLFLPMLPLDDLNVSGFENGRFTIKKTYSFAYQ